MKAKEIMKAIDNFLEKRLSPSELDKFWDMIFNQPELYSELTLTATLKQYFKEYEKP